MHAAIARRDRAAQTEAEQDRGRPAQAFGQLLNVRPIDAAFGQRIERNG